MVKPFNLVYHLTVPLRANNFISVDFETQVYIYIYIKYDS